MEWFRFVLIATVLFLVTLLTEANPSTSLLQLNKTVTQLSHEEFIVNIEFHREQQKLQPFNIRVVDSVPPPFVVTEGTPVAASHQVGAEGGVHSYSIRAVDAVFTLKNQSQTIVLPAAKVYYTTTSAEPTSDFLEPDESETEWFHQESNSVTVTITLPIPTGTLPKNYSTLIVSVFTVIVPIVFAYSLIHFFQSRAAVKSSPLGHKHK